MPRLVFPFHPLPGRIPPIPRPAIWLRLVGPRGDLSLPIPGLLDTGSFSTILPQGTAEDVGIRPQAGSPFSIAIGGSTVQAREAGEVLLRIGGRERTGIGEERVLEIRSRPLLVDSPLFLDLALLGSRGFLDRIDEFCVRAREEVFEIAQGETLRAREEVVEISRR